MSSSVSFTARPWRYPLRRQPSADVAFLPWLFDVSVDSAEVSASPWSAGVVVGGRQRLPLVPRESRPTSHPLPPWQPTLQPPPPPQPPHPDARPPSAVSPHQPPRPPPPHPRRRRPPPSLATPPPASPVTPHPLPLSPPRPSLPPQQLDASWHPQSPRVGWRRVPRRGGEWRPVRPSTRTRSDAASLLHPSSSPLTVATVKQFDLQHEGWAGRRCAAGIARRARGRP